MRVAVFHNFYRSSRPSGENNAVLADVRALREAGHEVLLADRSSDDALGGRTLSRARAAASAVYSIDGRRAASRLIEAFCPDVAHLHNLIPMWSPSITDALAAACVPRIQVLHNYRLSCLNGSHMLDGEPCFRCLGRRLAGPGVRHRCYNDSTGGSAVLAASRVVNERRLMSADRYLAVSAVVRERAVQHGLAADAIGLKPEYLDADAPPPADAGTALVFVGRLDRNKGCLLLLDAYERYRGAGGTLPLRVVGSGPLEAELRKRADGLPAVRLLGQMEPAAARAEIAAARAVVSPAIWAEPFGLTVLEAWRSGRPVVVTDLGGPAGMVSADTGWVVPTQPDALAAALAAVENADEAHRRGLAGLRRLRSSYSSSAVLTAYEDAWVAVGAGASQGQAPRR